MKRKLLIIGIGAVAILGILLIIRDDSANGPGHAQQAAPQGVPVTVGTVSPMRIEYTLQQVGTLAASRDVMLRSRTQGRVTEILFEEGRPVKKDEVLVRIDDAKIIAEIENLKAHIDQLEIRLENKRRSLERNRSLVEQDLISREMYDNLQTEINEIKAQITQVKAGLAQQEERLADTVIRAPFEGVAGPRTFSVGHYLGIGDPVVSIVDLDALEIAFKVPEIYKPRVEPGQEVHLAVDAYPGKNFIGEIFFIDPEVAVDTRAFLVKARVDNSENALNPGMFARAELVTEVHEEAPTVPWESIIQTENETYLYGIEGNNAKKYVVRLGKITGPRAEILEPLLNPGQSIILEGKYSVKDGSEIRIVEVNGTKEAAPGQGA
ncbi:MAG: efflux RND transporter periplasmic adaptor subunit [Desulfobacterales bacterium]